MASFGSLGLDIRILKAISKRQYDKPTPIQAECIPKALEGKDIVARAPTGSGKTLAYLLPAFHRILTSGLGRAGWQALVLVPTRELCEQVKEEALSLASSCGPHISVTAISGSDSSLRHVLATAGALVVSTPAKIAAALQAGILNTKMLERTLRTFVLDEADLLLSYGYEQDVMSCAPVLPRTCQSILISATMNEAVQRLAKRVLHAPIFIDIVVQGDQKPHHSDEGNAPSVSPSVDHHSMLLRSTLGAQKSVTTEKLLHILALLRLGLVQNKVLLFVNDAEEGMRVRLFLDAFGIRAATVHADLPLNTRHHILQQFNKGLFDYLIATDDIHAKRSTEKKSGNGSSASSKKGKKERDAEFGVTRGLDFRGVKTVINVQLPESMDGYMHRVGRTGRAGDTGIAITLMTSDTEAFFKGCDIELKPFDKLSKAAVEALRYRAEDVARSITKAAIREARAAEIKAELLNSKRLKAFFEERPSDLNALRHDQPLGSVVTANAAHLKHLPAYLRDSGASGSEILRRQGRGILSSRKKRKIEGIDPLKGFAPAPKRAGGDKHEPMTEIEKKALENARKAKKKKEIVRVMKTNVRKHSGRKR